jgi:hypothetical protein
MAPLIAKVQGTNLNIVGLRSKTNLYFIDYIFIKD